MNKIGILFLMLGIFTSCSKTQIDTPSSSLPRENTDNSKALTEANILNNKGVNAYKNGDYKRAIYFFQKSLAIKERVLGTEDLNTATS